MFVKFEKYVYFFIFKCTCLQRNFQLLTKNRKNLILLFVIKRCNKKCKNVKNFSRYFAIPEITRKLHHLTNSFVQSLSFNIFELKILFRSVRWLLIHSKSKISERLNILRSSGSLYCNANTRLHGTADFFFAEKQRGREMQQPLFEIRG